MKIKRMISQNMRDFTAIYVCEICGVEKTSYGYDDWYFHDTVIPKMICKACGWSSKDAGTVAGKTETRYQEGQAV